MDLQNSIHFILQGKGGIGKSFICAVLSQWLKDQTDQLYPYDTDQENTTFKHYKAIGAEHIPLMNDSRTIDAKRFDALIEKLLTPESGIAVIDNGANTFSPLLAYLVENDVINFLQENGKKVFIHTVVGGGDTFLDTAIGFRSITEGVPEAPLVLWMNEHFGTLQSPDGKGFTEMAVYLENQDRIAGTVLLAARNHQTYGDDIKRMNQLRLTFDEVMRSTAFSIMEKQRLKQVARDIYHQLDEIQF
ncbi:nucleotide-binding protein [Pseudomonas sp. Q1-7]|uniref:nucleotide-binding protein n=1 Tax=Pseudomonas sp. Q1-7 TaxID=3020843 RepID=UPI002301E83C|nr:conjugal transfer protein TraL [Pseudomonas sp. Q1-7]